MSALASFAAAEGRGASSDTWWHVSHATNTRRHEGAQGNGTSHSRAFACLTGVHVRGYPVTAAPLPLTTTQTGTRGANRFVDESVSDDVLQEISKSLFASLPRTDQRNKGVAYVKGLLKVTGRKSIRNIANLVGGRATDQSLHHFISESTWDWMPVRQALSRYLVPRLPVEAWVVQNTVIRKAGQHSVGVDRRFVPAEGRVLMPSRRSVSGPRRAGAAARSTGPPSPPGLDRRRIAPQPRLHTGHRRGGAADRPGRQPLCRHDDGVGDAGTPGGPGPRPAMYVPTIVNRLGRRGIPMMARIDESVPLVVTDPRSPVTTAPRRCRRGRWRGRPTASGIPSVGISPA